MWSEEGQCTVTQSKGSMEQLEYFISFRNLGKRLSQNIEAMVLVCTRISRFAANWDGLPSITKHPFG